ncbi:MAG: cytochrome c3 family protein [Deltaproteobacteria bacterium]|jgi:c(7)-type cytochrome triheme protein|nr:cytochrome c3 family protein [Deltaproteobacteria bacterium]
MRKNGNTLQTVRFATLLLAVMFALAFVSPFPVQAEDDEAMKYLEKARLDAEKAKADAAKAMAEAEKAMAEADRAIAEAEKNKAAAREAKEDAMEKMVEHGYFPDDISLDTPDGSVRAVFSHKKHTQRERLRCIECHPKVFVMKKGKNVVKGGALTMEEMKKGKYCGNCHNGHKAFSVNAIDSCKRCHPKNR